MLDLVYVDVETLAIAGPHCGKNCLGPGIVLRPEGPLRKKLITEKKKNYFLTFWELPFKLLKDSGYPKDQTKNDELPQ